MLGRVGCGLLAGIAAILIAIPLVVVTWQLGADFRVIDLPIGNYRLRTFVAGPVGFEKLPAWLHLLSVRRGKAYYIIIDEVDGG